MNHSNVPFKLGDQKLNLRSILLVIIIATVSFGAFASDKESIIPTQTGQLLFWYLLVTVLFFCLLAFNFGIVGSIRLNILDCCICIAVLYSVAVTYLNYTNPPNEILFAPGFLIIYISIRTCTSTGLIHILTSLLVVGIVEALYGNLQLVGFLQSNHAAFRITGTFFNPAPFAGFLVLIVPVAVVFLMYGDRLKTTKFQQKVFRVLSPVTIIVILGILPASGSRAAWIATIVSSCYIFLTYPPIKERIMRSRNDIKKRMALIVTFFIIGCASFIIYKFKKDSADGRILIWKIAGAIFLERPLVGFGQAKFKSIYMDHQAKYFQESNRTTSERVLADNVIYAYNEPLRIGIEFGIIGLLILVVVISLVFYSSIETDSVEGLLILLSRGGLLSLIVFSFFSYPSDILPIVTLGTFYLAMIGTNYNGKKLCLFNASSKIKLLRVSLFILALICLIVGVRFFVRQKKSYKQWGIANALYSNANYSESLKYYQDAYLEFANNGMFLSHYGKALYMCAEFDTAIKILNASKEYNTESNSSIALADSYKAIKRSDEAEAAYLRASYMVPSQLYPRYCLAKLYEDTGDLIKARSVASDILSMNPKINSQATSEIRNEMQALITRIDLITVR